MRVVSEWVTLDGVFDADTMSNGITPITAMAGESNQ
jgi:hypothetical protein